MKVRSTKLADAYAVDSLCVVFGLNTPQGRVIKYGGETVVSKDVGEQLIASGYAVEIKQSDNNTEVEVTHDVTGKG